MSVLGREDLEQDPLVVHFTGEIDAGDDAFVDDLLAQAGLSDRLIVDMLNVSFVDSSVIRGLVLAHRRVAETGGWLRVVYTHHLVRRVIEMCGLADAFPQYATVMAASNDVRSSPPASESHRPGESS